MFPLPIGRVGVARVELRAMAAIAGGARGRTMSVSIGPGSKTIKVAEGKLPKTIPLQISLGEGMDIGIDVGSPVDFTYKLPFAFTGRIEKVTYELK